MNREQAKKLLPIIQAFADGKIIQSIRINGRWLDLEMKDALNITRVIEEPQKYRIKPEPKCRPFKDAEECWQEMQKHQPLGWIKDESWMYNIITIKEDGIIIHNGFNNSWYEFNKNFNFTFTDGTPFGIKEE